MRAGRRDGRRPLTRGAYLSIIAAGCLLSGSLVAAGYLAASVEWRSTVERANANASAALDTADQAIAAGNEARLAAFETSEAARIRIKRLEADLTKARAQAAKAEAKHDAHHRPGPWRTATASWYGREFYGRNTANGTRYTAELVCVAHRSLPFGTRVEVEYRGRRIIAPVLDRGPFIDGRDFDLSAAVADELGFDGVQAIRWRVLP